MSEFVLKHNSNGLWYGIFTHMSDLGIKHGVSCRLGGTSSVPFSSLNLALHTGDSDQSVIQNRELFCKSVGINADNIVTAEQIHGEKIVIVNENHIGRGAKKYSDAIAGADALVTNIPGIPLMLFFADCVPVLIADPVNKVIGIAHAGWKGTVSKIAQKTVLTMHNNFGTNIADCLVGIAPSIGACCYEVNDTVIDKVKTQFTYWQQLINKQDSKYFLDLWQANALQLEEIGVLRKNIVISNVCTKCNNDLFFSYRAENKITGRIGAIIVL